jgi:hypothetical protein
VVRPKEIAQLDWLRRETRERYVDDQAAPPSQGAGTGKMSNCPSAVEGASTVIRDGNGSFDVVVTAPSDSAVHQIRDRARHLAEAARAAPVAVAHTGGGTGGGAVGRCPVVMKDTAITAREIDGGVELTVAPTKPEELLAIRREAHERVEKFGAITR